MTPKPPGLTLEMTCVLPAPRSLVFSALTEPDELATWWGPRGFTTPSIELDLRVGGSYRFAMQPPEFTEVDPPDRLSYTFRWEEPAPDDQETVVTLTLGDLGESTELALTQGTFATEERRSLHNDGWSDGFERLQNLISSKA